ncbi:MAG: polysaccharide deacetylase family protein [Cyanobacteria bacterium SID2]|nr:polysaccharide deacetylase family protein [Cyanobacteria bacterium SID2]MBP0002322.1 polysaccharide deacetylase family protein [Cyanobacteria bacterium SBC]
MKVLVTTWDKFKVRYAKILKKLAIFCLAFWIGIGLFRISTELLFEEIPIFGFHDIVDLNNPKEQPPNRPEFSSDYTKADFEIFLTQLVRKNYWFLTSQDLYDYFLSDTPKSLSPEQRKRKKVAIAIDDGYQSANDNILPILEKLDRTYDTPIKIVWFVNPAFMGIPGTYLDHASCEDFRIGLEKGYYDIQSHTSNHEDLTQLDAEGLTKELLGSQQLLRECTKGLDPKGQVANHISYPFGKVNKFVLKEVKKYYRSGYLYNGKTFRLDWFRNRYFIPRMTVSRSHTVKQLLKMASGGWL